MKDPLEHNDFEKELKKAAESFSPQPSDRVWESVSEELHPRRRTYWLAAAAVILLLLAVGVYFLQKQYSSSRESLVAQKASPVAPASPAEPDNKTSGEHRAESQPVPAVASSGNSTGKLQGSLAGEAHKNNAPVPVGRSGITGKKGYQTFASAAKNRGNEQIQRSDIKSRAAETVELPPLHHLSMQLFNPVSEQYAELSPLQEKNNSGHVSDIPSGKKEPFNKKETTSGKKPHQKPVMEIFYAPGIGYRALRSGTSGATATYSSSTGQFNGSSGRPSPALSNLKQSPEWSWSAGVRVAFPFSGSWSLQTGLSVAQLNYDIPAYGTYPVYVQNNNSSYYAAAPSRSLSALSTNALAATQPSVMDLHNSYLFGEVPVLLMKQFGKPHRLSLRIGAGVGLSYMLHSSAVIYSPSSGRYFTDNHYVRPVNGDFLIETAILIPLNARLILDAGPSFQYQVLSSYKNYPAVKEHPYLLGLKVGLEWKGKGTKSQK